MILVIYAIKKFTVKVEKNNMVIKRIPAFEFDCAFLEIIIVK